MEERGLWAIKAQHKTDLDLKSYVYASAFFPDELVEGQENIAVPALFNTRQGALEGIKGASVYQSWDSYTLTPVRVKVVEDEDYQRGSNRG